MLFVLRVKVLGHLTATLINVPQNFSQLQRRSSVTQAMKWSSIKPCNFHRIGATWDKYGFAKANKPSGQH